MDEGEQSVWGWEQFFEEMESFIRTAHRGFESSSPQFAEYVVERLRIIIQALSSILTPLEDQEEDELNDLHSSIDEIITCCRSLGALWQSYIDEMDMTCKMKVNDTDNVNTSLIQENNGSKSVHIEDRCSPSSITKQYLLYYYIQTKR